MVEYITPADLARKAIKYYLEKAVILDFSCYKLLDIIRKNTGVYVSLKLPDGTLRGCRGTKYPKKETLEEEIIANAISSATKDPRFSVLTLEELKYICIKVYLLNKFELINDLQLLNPKQFGILVKSNTDKQAIILPGIRNDLLNAQDQVNYVRQKGNISLEEEIEIYRFTTDIYE